MVHVVLHGVLRPGRTTPEDMSAAIHRLHLKTRVLKQLYDTISTRARAAQFCSEGTLVVLC